jgi:hypothetical protein
MLAAGSLLSIAIGVAILPLSLLGVVFFGIGLLGLTPFFSAALFAPTITAPLGSMTVTRSVERAGALID